MVSMLDKTFVLLYLETEILQAPSKKAGKKGAAATSKKAGGAAGKVAKVRIQMLLAVAVAAGAERAVGGLEGGLQEEASRRV